MNFCNFGDLTQQGGSHFVLLIIELKSIDGLNRFKHNVLQNGVFSRDILLLLWFLHSKLYHIISYLYWEVWWTAKTYTSKSLHWFFSDENINCTCALSSPPSPTRLHLFFVLTPFQSSQHPKYIRPHPDFFCLCCYWQRWIPAMKSGFHSLPA